MLQDPDYRVRLNLARRIGVLFQTWDGHDELFRDIWLDVYNFVLFLLHLHYYLDNKWEGSDTRCLPVT